LSDLKIFGTARRISGNHFPSSTVAGRAEAKCQRALRGGEGIFERRLRSVNIRAMGEDVGHAI
jgi:hypothetical protein